MPMWLQRDLMVAAGKQQSSGKIHKFLLAVKGIAVTHLVYECVVKRPWANGRLPLKQPAS